uniref:SSD domain-containing protein n=1 Tax=Loa loa TaxID=7209 RepID=A0A1I7VFR4_LOALO
MPLSKSWSEREYYRRFYNLTFDPYTIVLSGESVDGGSMLRPDKFIAMEQEAERGLRMHLVGNGFQNRTLGSYVYLSSKPFYEAISEAIKIQSNENAVLGYPTMNLYGINFTTRNVFRRYSNGFVGMLVYFFVFADHQDVVSSIKRTEVEWNNKLKHSSESSVRFRLFGDEIVNTEIFVGSVGSLPYFLTGSLAMVIFIFLSILHYNETFLQTVFLTLWTAFCPCLAGFTSVAIFSLLGRTLNSSMLVTPFMVLAVGVDDAFLVLHKWFTSVELDPSSRLTSVLVETGPSITLTSVTNICAFMAFMEHELFPVFMKYVPDRAAELLDTVAHVHNLDCLCPNYKTWIEEYAALYGHTNDTTENFFGNIMKYLDYNPELTRNLVLRFDSSGTATVDKISFDLCIHGYGSWRDRAFIHEQIRKKMPEELLVYDYDSTLFDIILTARETMFQSCIITPISMLLLCTLFIPSGRAIAFVLLSIISVTTVRGRVNGIHVTDSLGLKIFDGLIHTSVRRGLYFWFKGNWR